jgi:hypothetical protein
VGVLGVDSPQLNRSDELRRGPQLNGEMDGVAVGDGGEGADHCHEIVVSLGFDLEHGKARVLVVERDALNQPGQAVW